MKKKILETTCPVCGVSVPVNKVERGAEMRTLIDLHTKGRRTLIPGGSLRDICEGSLRGVWWRDVRRV